MTELFLDKTRFLLYHLYMIILGIDPGYAIVGYGAISVVGSKQKLIDYGAITTPKTESMPNRLFYIAEEMEKVLQKYSPDAIAVEELFFYNNQKTAIAVAEARGALLVPCLKSKAKLYEFTPMQVKQALTGYGREDKNQIQQMVKILLGLDKIPKPDDAADALAIAITCAQTNKLSDLFGM